MKNGPWSSFNPSQSFHRWGNSVWNGVVGEGTHPGSQESRLLCFFVFFSIVLPIPGLALFLSSLICVPGVFTLTSSLTYTWCTKSPLVLCLLPPAQGEIWPSLYSVHGFPASSCFMWTWSGKRSPGGPSRWVQWPWEDGYTREKLPRSW